MSCMHGRIPLCCANWPNWRNDAPGLSGCCLSLLLSSHAYAWARGCPSHHDADVFRTMTGRDLKYPRVSFGRKRSNVKAKQARTASRSTFNTLARSRSSKAAVPAATPRPASKFGASPSLRGIAPPLRVTLEAATWPRTSAASGGGHRSINPILNPYYGARQQSENPVMNPYSVPAPLRVTLEAATWPRSSAALRPHRSSANPAAEPLSVPAAVPRGAHVKFSMPGAAGGGVGGELGAVSSGTGVVESESAPLLPHMAQPAEHLAVDVRLQP